MTKEQLAAELNGREYPADVPKELEEIARKSGLVIVYGSSDDLLEFRGAISEELGAYDGTTVYLDPSGLIQNECDNESCPEWKKKIDDAITIEAVWCETKETPPWILKTDIPHATFDIMEEGECQSRGIVFEISALKAMRT